MNYSNIEWTYSYDDYIKLFPDYDRENQDEEDLVDEDEEEE